ncbi:hypothetical protein [Maribellus mangrovi]|uniref:hypothetical protein n=1 Tax=Maribellus mangrovi TaxID=3133146 RepID=UPI0030EC270C
MKHYIPIIFLAILFWGCGGEMQAPAEKATDLSSDKSVEENMPEEDMVPEEETVAEDAGSDIGVGETTTTTSPQIDTSMSGMSDLLTDADLYEPNFKKLAIYCPHKMTYKKTSEVIGFVADLLDDEMISRLMDERVAETTGDEDFESADEDLLIRELQLFNFLELRLDDADNEGFTIKKIHDKDIQQVAVNMEGWHWKVTPTTTDAVQQLVLKVIVYDDNMKRVTSFDKTYHIDIKIESRLFLRNTYALFVENPEWAFASIITPVLTFLLGRYNSRRRRKKKKTDKGA